MKLQDDWVNGVMGDGRECGKPLQVKKMEKTREKDHERGLGLTLRSKKNGAVELQ